MSATPLVLGHRDGAAGGLGDVWHEVDSLAWLPLAPRIVVQVGGGGDRALATETARSLVEFLETRRVADVEIVDADRVPAASLRVGCVTSPGELVVPADWFESHALVTIAAAAPCAAARLAAGLDAQAEALRRLGNPHAPSDLVYEAHRLAASDLVVVCGRADFGVADSEAWWAVGADAVAVDATVVAAAGGEPDALPWLRALARHQTLPAPAALRGSLPDIRGHLAGAWRSRRHAVGARLSASAAAVRRDARMLRHNVHRIPNFVRRRLARREA
jgi:hypothetical protein